MENDLEEMKRGGDPPDPNRQAGQSADDPTVRAGEEPVTGESAPESDPN